MILNHLSQAGNFTEKDKNALIAAIHEQNKSKYDKVDRIAEYQKYVNTELDSCFCKLTQDYVPVEGECVPFQKASGSMNVQDGLITVKPGQRIQLDVSLGFVDTESTEFANVTFYIKDATSGKNIHFIKFLQGNVRYEGPYCACVQYTNDSDVDSQIGVFVQNIYVSDVLGSIYCSLTATEVGRQITIDPLEYVNTQQGIEDAPVGHIIACLGGAIPKHYLACNGSIYNIADYAYLAQYITENFGAVNHFGGDGISTFAVPKRGGVTHDYTPIMTGDTTPSPFVASAKDCSSGQPAYKAFNGTVASDTDCWAASTEQSWLKIDFGKPTMVSQFAITGVRTNVQYSPKDFVISGSNDDIHYDTLYIAENQSWTSAETKEYVLNDACTYRYFKIDILATNGAKYGAISLWKFYHITTNDYIKYEPTYYMQIHQTNYTQSNVYSEEEQVVGRWIDGKPVYRITVIGTTAAELNTHENVRISQLINVDALVSMTGCVLGANNDVNLRVPIERSDAITFWLNNGYINNKVGVIGYVSRPYYVTVEYTKTTDEPNSFTNDMIQDYVTTEPYPDEEVTNVIDTLWQ